MHVLILAFGLTAFAAGPSPLERAAAVLPPGLDLPAAPLPAAGKPVQTAGPDPQTGEVRVELQGLLNRHWTSAESMGEGPDKIFFGGQIDLEGNPFLAVSSPEWPGPRFIAIKRGMSGSWTVNKARYSVSLNVSIFRKKTNNFIVIEKEGSGKAYQMRIGELFLATAKAGQDVTIGGETYRLFYSNNVDVSKDPAVVDPDNYGFCLVHDKVEDGEHDFKFYLISRQDVVGKGPVAYKLFDDQILKFRLSDDLSTLEISR